MGLSMYKRKLTLRRDRRALSAIPRNAGLAGEKAGPDSPTSGWAGAGEGGEEMKGTTCC